MFFWNSLAFSMIQWCWHFDLWFLYLEKYSLCIWNFLAHVLLKPSLKDSEHYLASLWNECNCAVIWTFLGIAFLWDWNENWPFPVLCHCWVFQTCWHIECSTFTASSFRIWKSSTGIPSPPLPCLEWCFLRPTWLCIPGCLALGEWSHHHVYLGRFKYNF